MLLQRYGWDIHAIPNFFDGPWTVDLSDASAFEIKAPARGCACHRPSRRFSSRTYPQLAQIVGALRAVRRRCG